MKLYILFIANLHNTLLSAAQGKGGTLTLIIIPPSFILVIYAFLYIPILERFYGSRLLLELYQILHTLSVVFPKCCDTPRFLKISNA